MSNERRRKKYRLEIVERRSIMKRLQNMPHSKTTYTFRKVDWKNDRRKAQLQKLNTESNQKIAGKSSNNAIKTETKPLLLSSNDENHDS